MVVCSRRWWMVVDIGDDSERSSVTPRRAPGGHLSSRSPSRWIRFHCRDYHCGVEIIVTIKLSSIGIDKMPLWVFFAFCCFLRADMDEHWANRCMGGGSSENTWCRKKRWFEREISFSKYDTGMPFPKYDIRMRNKRRLKSWHLMLVLTTSIQSLILVQYCPVIALGSYWMTWPPSFPFLFLLFRKIRVLTILTEQQSKHFR